MTIISNPVPSVINLASKSSCVPSLLPKSMKAPSPPFTSMLEKPLLLSRFSLSAVMSPTTSNFVEGVSVPTPSLSLTRTSPPVIIFKVSVSAAPTILNGYVAEPA